MFEADILVPAYSNNNSEDLPTMNWQFVHELGTREKGNHLSWFAVCHCYYLFLLSADAKTRCRFFSSRLRWVTCNVSCTRGLLLAALFCYSKVTIRDNISKCCFILLRCAKNCVFANSTLCSWLPIRQLNSIYENWLYPIWDIVVCQIIRCTLHIKQQQADRVVNAQR